MNPATAEQEEELEHQNARPSRSHWDRFVGMYPWILVIAVLLAVIQKHHDEWLKGSLAVATIELGNGRSIVLSSPNGTEPVAELHFQAFEDGKPVWKYKTICATAIRQDFFSKTSYRIVSSADGHVVGLVTDVKPSVILLMVDFKGKQTWPGSLEWRDSDKRDLLLKAIESNHSLAGLKFHLDDSGLLDRDAVMGK